MQKPAAAESPASRKLPPPPALQSERCIQHCLECVKICQQARAYCLARGGRLGEPALIAALLDCAECCEMGARWLQRSSPFAAEHCALCAAVCKACEAACEAQPDDETLRACADACRRCVDTCLGMGQAATGALAH